MLLGLAAVLALMLVLLLLAAIGFGPERPRSLGPIPTPPSFEAKIGDSVPLAAPRLASVARGVAVRGTGVSSARPVSLAAGGGEGSGDALVVAPAKAVDVGGTPSPKPNQPAPESESAPAPAPAPAPVPVVAPSPSGGSAEGGGRSGPIAAGAIPPAEEGEGEEATCEATEYTVTVAFDAEAIFGGATDAEIHLHRVGSDGSELEMQAEGGIEDLVALFEQFASEGECVTVVVEPLSGEDGSEETEAPQAGAAGSLPAVAEPEPAAP